MFLPYRVSAYGSTFRSGLLTSSLLTSAAFGLTAVSAVAAPVLPTGGTVTSGVAGISTSGSSLTVTQSSQKAIISWQGFSIGQGATVNFNNGSGATLNRVSGSSASFIDGLLQATGTVYIVNPNGVIIGKTGVVNTGGTFVATTLDVTDKAFLGSGPLTFSGPSTASVVNLGKVGSLGGNVALIAQTVVNQGTLTAAAGTVGLAAGSIVTLTDSTADDGGLIAVQLGEAGTGLTNEGAIAAAAVELRAQHGNIYALAGNPGAAIDATGVSGKGGKIFLVSQTGTTTVQGALDAQGPNGSGGTIETSGGKLDLGQALINAHGGTWLIDPYDLTIDSKAATTIDTALNSGTSVVEQTTSTGVAGYGTSNSSGVGNITVASALTWSSGATLTLDAYRSIHIDAPISITGGGGLVLKTNDGGTGGDLYFGLGDSVTFASGQTGQSLTINGTSYSLVYTMAQLQALNGKSGAYALAQDQAPTTAYAGSVGGVFNGTLEGLGHTLAGLTVNGTTGGDTGLFSQIVGGVVRDLALQNATVSGGAYSNTGAVAGYIKNSTLANIAMTGQVSGAKYVGGLVGTASGSTLVNVMATGSVASTGAYAGGLVAYAERGSSIREATANVAVSAGSYAGGLVGFENGVSLTNVFAIGAVTAGSHAGGLLGGGHSGATTFSKAFWDTTTTGQTSSPFGGYSDSSVPFQSGYNPFSGDARFTGGQTYLYPYLSSFYPNGALPLNGIAFQDARGGVAASGSAGAVLLNLDINGVKVGLAPTGADGSFYFLIPLPQAPAGATFLISTPTNSATGMLAGAATGVSPAIYEYYPINLYGGYLLGLTEVSSLSSAPTTSSVVAQAQAAAQSDPAALSLLGGLSQVGLEDNVNRLTIDEAFTGSSLNLFDMSGIIVGAPVTISSGGALTLVAGGGNSGSGLQFNAPVAADGAVAVTLDFNSGAGVANTGITFGLGDSLSFNTATGGVAASSQGGSLTINGATYTLLYSMSDLQGIASGATGADIFSALAHDLAPMASYSGPVVASLSYGGLEGLGHQISGLTISASSANNIGLIGSLNHGYVRDLVLTGVTVTGGANTGAVVGYASQSHIANVAVSGTVTGGNNVGLLEGYSNRSGLYNSMTSGSVSGGTSVGGMVGKTYHAALSNVASSAATSGANAVGGLIGYAAGFNNLSGALATGRVMTAGPKFGGLVGEVSSSGAVAGPRGDYDVQTTGVSPNAKSHGYFGSGFGIAYSSAQLRTQGYRPSYAFGGGSGGLYPYLQSFYPHGVEAFSGQAFVDAGVTPAGAGGTAEGVVNLDVGGSLVAQGQLGADGSYYIALPAGSVTGAQFLVSTAANSAAATAAAATLANLTLASTENTVSGDQGGVDLFGGYLTVGTSAVTLSAAPTLSLAASQSAASTVAGSDAVAAGAISALTQTALLAQGASFTVDKAGSVNLLVASQSGTPIIVAAPQTVAAGASLTLVSGDALAIDAPITVDGAGTVTLAYLADAGPAGTGLTFALGDSISFNTSTGAVATSDQGGQLNINGAAYTLLYSLADAQTALGASQSGDFAMAQDFAPTATYASAVIPTFNGVFEGLGHQIAGLTISVVSGHNVGLFGNLGSSATVRDLVLAGGSVYAPHSSNVGALAGYTYGATIANIVSSAQVTGKTNVGGLVGYLHSVNIRGQYVGSLANAMSTGAVNGYANVGGLVGYLYRGTIRNAVATGPVSGHKYVGGLVGYANSGHIYNVLATGSVAATSYGGGGLVGGSRGGNYIRSGYFDTNTTGQSYRGYGTGVSTSHLQNNFVSYRGYYGRGSSFNPLGQAFGGGQNGLYPYLKSFYPNGVEAVSGYVISGPGGALVGSGANGQVTVSLDAGGGQVGEAAAGANGYYYIALPAGSLAGGSGFVVSTPANSATGMANAASLATSAFAASGDASLGGIELLGGYLLAGTTATTLSAAEASLTLTGSQSQAVALAGSDSVAATAIGALSNLGYLATGTSFTIDQPQTGASLVVAAASSTPLTVAAPITVPNAGALTLLAADSLKVNAPIAVEGAGAVNLYGSTSSQDPTAGLFFAAGDSISFDTSAGAAATSSQGGTLTINGQTVTLLYTMSDLQGINTKYGAYALAQDLAPTATYSAAVVPSFFGSLEGLGHSITGLNISAPTTNNVGLFGVLSVGEGFNSAPGVRDLVLSGGSVSGGFSVGALAGVADGVNIANVSSSLGVYGLGNVGGLVGVLSGMGPRSAKLVDSTASGAVTSGANSRAVGGLVGYSQRARIIASSASGSVSGVTYVGGLVGIAGTQSQSTSDSASGAVSGHFGVGGLIGEMKNAAYLSNSSASGAVSGYQTAGGLVGLVSRSRVLDSSASGAVTGHSYLGGLVGYAIDYGAYIGSSRATGAVTGSGTGSAVVGGLVGGIASGAEVQGSSASGAVTGLKAVGGLVGDVRHAYVYNSMATGAVAGVQHVGGLIGFSGYATISNVMATGAVAASGATVGGLVGYAYQDRITNAVAMGAVTGAGQVGGLVGYATKSNLQSVLATGAVSSSAGRAGGLIGAVSTAATSANTVTNGYWDTQTTGQSASVGGGTGLVTAALQGGAAGGLGTGLAGGTDGLYPYVKALFPNGVHAISGLAFSDGGVTPAASGLSGAVTVSLDAGGSQLAQATTGANGYYYILLPAGSVAGGQSFLLTTAANSATGAANAATLGIGAGPTASPNQSEVDLFGGYLTAGTTATTLSAAQAGLTLASAQTAGTSAAGTDAAAAGVLNALTTLGYLAEGTSFTIDEAQSASRLLVETALGTPLTVAQPITVTSGGALTLSSGGTLAINAPVTVNGAGAVDISYEFGGGLTFALGDSLSFNNADGSVASQSQGGSLTINGASYQLIYNMSALPSLSGGSADVAIATDLNPSAVYSSAVIGYFGGRLEGLGHAINNLQINAPTADRVALVGVLKSGGNINNIVLRGGAVKGNYGVGAVVGYSYGVLNHIASSASVSGAYKIGGLAGEVSGSFSGIFGSVESGAVSGGSAVGGLIGLTRGAISPVYGAVVTGSVSGNTGVGGLIGNSGGGYIGQVLVTGPVHGSGGVGPLIGSGAIGATHLYSAYWDTQTTGQSTSTVGGKGLTTAQLGQGGATLTSGPFAFGGGAGGLLPYLASFYPNGVQALEGTAPVGAQVGVYVGGGLVSGGPTSVGADGSVYAIVPAGTLSATTVNKVGDSLIASGATGASAVSYTDQASLSGNVLALPSLTSGEVLVSTTEPTLSALQADFASTFGGSTFSTLTGQANAPLSILTASSASGFTVDVALTSSGAFDLINPLGGVSLADPITSGGSILIAANGAFSNTAGASALTVGAGASYTVYSQVTGNATGALPTNSLGGLTGVNWYNDAYNFTTGAFATAVPTGDHFVYGYVATLTPTVTGSVSKVYDGTTVLTSTTGLGLTATLLNAGGLADSATLAFASGVYDASNAGTGIGVTLSGASFASNPNNYLLGATTASGDVGTINPAALLIFADNQSATQGVPVTLGTTAFTVTGLVSGTKDAVSSVDLTSAGASATTAGAFSIIPSAAQGSGLTNYAITYENGTLTVTAAPPVTTTPTPPSQAVIAAAVASLPAASYAVNGTGTGLPSPGSPTTSSGPITLIVQAAPASPPVTTAAAPAGGGFAPTSSPDIVGSLPPGISFASGPVSSSGGGASNSSTNKTGTGSGSGGQ